MSSNFIITEPGVYETRSGGTVHITHIDDQYNCYSTDYPNAVWSDDGTHDCSEHDIIRPASLQFVAGMQAGIAQIEYLLTMPQLNEIKPLLKELQAQRKHLQALLKK